MQLTFSVDGKPAVLNRNCFSGRLSLEVDGKTTTIQNPWNPLNWFGLQLTRAWMINALGHRIFIEKTRPFLFPALRPQTCRVKVDGELIAEQTGY